MSTACGIEDDCPDGYECNVEEGVCYLAQEVCDALGEPCVAGSCCGEDTLGGLRCFDDVCDRDTCVDISGTCDQNSDCCGRMECDDRQCRYPADHSGDLGDPCDNGEDCKEDLMCGITGKCKKKGIIGLYIGMIVAVIILVVVVVLFIIYLKKKKKKTPPVVGNPEPTELLAADALVPVTPTVPRVA